MSETTERDEKKIVRVLAERVMNWQLRESTQGATLADTGAAIFAIGNHGVSMMRRWNPLESWADAGMLLEALAKKCGMITLEVYMDGEASVVRERLIGIVDAESGPRAISLAAYEWAKSQEKQNA